MLNYTNSNSFTITTRGTLSMHEMTRADFDRFPSDMPEQRLEREENQQPYWCKAIELQGANNLWIYFYTNEAPVAV